jgi:FMN phosphatase YigB (HAD superfamily)
MPAAKLRAIIFDIGRVLIRVDLGRAMQGLASGTALSPSEMWTAIEKDPRWPDWQDGRISPHDWYLHLNKRLGGNLTFEQFTEVWNRALDPAPIHEDVLFKRLSKHYRLALLSNTDPIHVRHIFLLRRRQQAESLDLRRVSPRSQSTGARSRLH